MNLAASKSYLCISALIHLILFCWQMKYLYCERKGTPDLKLRRKSGNRSAIQAKASTVMLMCLAFDFLCCESEVQMVLTPAERKEWKHNCLRHLWPFYFLEKACAMTSEWAVTMTASTQGPRRACIAVIAVSVQTSENEASSGII